MAGTLAEAVVIGSETLAEMGGADDGAALTMVGGEASDDATIGAAFISSPNLATTHVPDF